MNGGADLLKLLRGLPEKLKVLAIPAGANALWPQPI